MLDENHNTVDQAIQIGEGTEVYWQSFPNYCIQTNEKNVTVVCAEKLVLVSNTNYQ